MPTARGAAYTVAPTPYIGNAASYASTYASLRHALGAALTFLNTTPVAAPEPLPFTLQIYPRVNTTQAT
jgi:hypothetical protein